VVYLRSLRYMIAGPPGQRPLPTSPGPMRATRGCSWSAPWGV